MSALGLLDEFGFEAAAIVLGPEGERERRGDVERIRPWRSVTKTLTGLGAAIALQEGRVALEDEAGPPGATLRHLLSHASGYFYESASTLQAPGLRRRHHRGEPLVLIFFLKEKNSYLDRYLSNFLTFIIACYYIVQWFWYPPPSALVLSMIRMWYIYYLYNYWFIYCL